MYYKQEMWLAGKFNGGSKILLKPSRISTTHNTATH